MKENEIRFPEDFSRKIDNFWDDPQKVMYLIDLLFMFDDQDRKQVYS